MMAGTNALRFLLLLNVLSQIVFCEESAVSSNGGVVIPPEDRQRINRYQFLVDSIKATLNGATANVSLSQQCHDDFINYVDKVRVGINIMYGASDSQKIMAEGDANQSNDWALKSKPN